MATKATTGKSAILAIGSGESPTPVLQVKTWSFSGQQAKYDDTTNAGSPAQGAAVMEEAIPSTVSPGQLTVSGVFLPTDPGQESLASAFLSQALTSFTFTFPLFPGQTTTGNSYAFSGYVQDMPNAVDVDYSKAINFKTTIKIQGPITVTAGS